ncbi:hypothetical protein E4U53_001743 [Claviceps sorghi]|nr:hypothetical protein E4U53_001743 [Claviceps sorghi]
MDTEADFDIPHAIVNARHKHPAAPDLVNGPMGHGWIWTKYRASMTALGEKGVWPPSDHKIGHLNQPLSLVPAEHLRARLIRTEMEPSRHLAPFSR